ncbi:hypothetical protein [Bradyrhizobium prioriisuperbiae]|uniref:hypothetical protein n=1 Tax=Bradyrhizobium prioriisuperbiae TaxID=2854389 RepID=UPI0028EC45ED|nr:hypothetical protein [Bradyrhizobium prioritasuperba]
MLDSFHTTKNFYLTVLAQHRMTRARRRVRIYFPYHFKQKADAARGNCDCEIQRHL